jgi:tetratricopeptide repeat protein 21B
VREFEGTAEEVRVTVADCELAIAAGDVEGALQRLRRVPPSSAHYAKARCAMADIFLRHRHDRAAYIRLAGPAPALLGRQAAAVRTCMLVSTW